MTQSFAVIEYEISKLIEKNVFMVDHVGYSPPEDGLHGARHKVVSTVVIWGSGFALRCSL